MKKTRSILALLLLGGLVMAGCEKKEDTPSSDNTTPSGDTSSGDNSQGGSSGGNSQGGGGQQGGGQQGSGGQQGGGEQGGGGQGGGEQQQGSRFVGKKLTIADAKDQYGQPLDNAVRDSILNSYGDGWVSLFDNFKFELVNPLPSTSYDVIKGNYEVANNDTSCVLTTSKIFSGEHQVYSYVIPTEMASFTITYSLNTQQYSVAMAEETGPDEYFLFTLILQAADASPEPVNIPEDPNGEDFDPHYQVTKTRWDQLFNSEGGIVQENFTVSHPIKFGEQVVDTDTWEVNNNKIHYFSASQPLLDFYYQIKSPIIEEGVVQAFNTYTCYQYAADDWRLNSNGGLDLGNLIHGSGLLQFDISKFNFSNFESTHYYYRSSLNLTCDYDDAGHNLTDIKVWFNNGNLQKIEYTEFGEKAEFTFTKCGSTTFTFPIDVPQGGGMTTSYSQARTAFANATGITLPEREGLEVETSPFTPGVSTSFCFDINSGATQADLTAFKDFFDNLQGWSLENTNVAGGYTTYSYENTDEDTIQLVWDGNNNGIYINYIWNDNGGDPQPAEWPTATVNSYLAAIGVTTDSLPAAQDGNVTEYTFTPDLASVDDFFMIRCTNGGSLSATYEGLLGEAHFEYDNSEYWYVSPHQEFAVTYSTDGLDNFNIYVEKLVAATPEPAASYLTAKASFEAATGIGLPTINDLDAYYNYDAGEHWYEFRTDSGAPLGTFEAFEDHLDGNLPAEWSKGNLEEPVDAKRYVYSHTNGDSIELYFATDSNYIVVTFTEYVGGGGGGGGSGGGGGGGGGELPPDPPGPEGTPPFDDVITWESVIGDPPGPEITPEQAENVIQDIITYRASTKVNNARVDEYEDGSIIKRGEFDTDSLAAYSWGSDDNTESFTFVEESTGYYYFTDPDLDYERPEIEDWYCTFANIDAYDYDWENEATEYNSRFKGLMVGAYGLANVDIDIDTSFDYSAYGGTVKYYSSGAGHIRCVAEIASYVMVTEWKNYKPLLYGSPESFYYFTYDVSVKKPESRGNYTLYGEF